MLLDFTVGNFGPFRDDATLSMHATNVGEHPDNLLVPNPTREDVLSSAIIFGPNAAGKTFITDALMVLADVVRTVDGGVSPSLYVPYRPSAACRTAPTRFRVRLILEGILYDYRVEYIPGTVTSESLYHHPKGRSARVFSRTGPDEFVGTRRRISDITGPGRTYLAMASVGGDPVCTRVRNAILNDFIVLRSDLHLLVQASCRFSGDHAERKAMAIRALNTADLGISDYTFRERQVNLTDIAPEIYDRVLQGTDPLHVRDIFLRHGFTDPSVDPEGSEFPMEAESAGTRCVFGLTGPLIDALENGKVLIMDELGAHLHPSLTRWIVGLFSQGNNPNGAQLVANTHDIGLMDISELLRRDQIWFVNRSRSDGSSELFCLSDFKGVRKDTDVLRRYLDGRFDALPAVRHRGVIG